MGLLWRLVSPFVSTFNAAPTVKIHDPVLGVANRLLQAIVCCGIAVMLYTDPPLYTEAPNAKAKFFASSGTLAELQAAPATYCGEGHLYGYGDEYCESTRTAGFGLFCEYGLTCANFDYAELNVKGETEMIFPTIVKDLEVELGEASDAFKARCGEASEVRYAGAELTRAAYLENGVYETSDSGQARCKHMNNYWAKGAEGMAMVVQHSYTASTKIPEAYREGTNKDVPTYIHRHGDNLDARGAEIEDVGDWVYRDCTTTAGVHKKRCDFEANEAIRLSVGEWLRIAGIASLDDHNAAAYRPSAQEGVTRLSHRTTGVLVKVTMYYVADHWMKPELHILLQSDDGWHSTGSEVHYVDYPVYDVARDVFVSGRFFDRYKRAVKFEFVTNEGRLRVVEQNVIFLRITALLVFMAISGTLVTMIAQSLLGYKSKVYKAHTKDDVKLEEVGSEIAANAVVAAACFRVACRPGARRLGKGDVFRLLVSTGHEPRAAARLANFLVASDETGQGIGMTAFANLLADGVPVAAAVRIARNLGHSGSTKAFRVAPAPAGPDITVAGAYRADCNGTYKADGRWQGHCRWKHETNDVWLRRDGGGWCLLNIRQPSFVFYRVDGPSAKGKFRSAVKGIIRERRWRPLSFLWRRGNVQVPGAPPTHGWRDGGCGGGASPHLVFSASGDTSTAAATESGAGVGARPPVVVQSWEATGAAAGAAGATAAGAAGGVGAAAGVGGAAGAMAADAAGGARELVGGAGGMAGGAVGAGNAVAQMGAQQAGNAANLATGALADPSGAAGDVARYAAGPGARAALAGAGAAGAWAQEQGVPVGGAVGAANAAARMGAPLAGNAANLATGALADPSGAAGDLYGAGADMLDDFDFGFDDDDLDLGDDAGGILSGLTDMVRGWFKF